MKIKKILDEIFIMLVVLVFFSILFALFLPENLSNNDKKIVEKKDYKKVQTTNYNDNKNYYRINNDDNLFDNKTKKEDKFDENKELNIKDYREKNIEDENKVFSNQNKDKKINFNSKEILKESGLFQEDNIKKIKDFTIDNSMNLININTANIDKLMLIDGIGKKTAEKIIEYRNVKPFKNIEDIMKIKGIGEKKFKKIKEQITVN